MPKNNPIKIVHLYADEMNIYGDNGNIEILLFHLLSNRYDVKVLNIGVGDSLPEDADFVFGGGGQDSNQNVITDDLESKKSTIFKLASNNVPMLMICGMYQLFGQYFLTNDLQKLKGIGYFDIHTEASSTRLIGNQVINSKFGQIIGYENHSGLTYLNSEQSLGECQLNQGNNGQDMTEGCIKNNVIGTYMHGPVLSKSSGLLEYLIKSILSNKGVDISSLDFRYPKFYDSAVQTAKTLKR